MATLRHGTESDLAAIRGIYAPYITDTAISFEYEVPSAGAFLQRYRDITRQFPWLVCEIEGEIAGYAYASPAFSRAAYQWDCDLTVYVGRQFQRRGIATALYHAMEELLYQQGYYNLYAIITGDNQKSLNYHSALGYQPMAVMPNSGYKQGKWHDIHWYWKAIRSFDDIPAAPCAYETLKPEVTEAVLNRFQQEIH